MRFGPTKQPSVWERVKMAKPLRLSNSFEPISKFENKLDMNLKGKEKDDKKSNKAREAGILSAMQKRNGRARKDNKKS